MNQGIFLHFQQIFVNGGPMRLELVAVAVGPDSNFFSFESWSATRYSKNVLVHIWLFRHNKRCFKHCLGTTIKLSELVRIFKA